MKNKLIFTILLVVVLIAMIPSGGTSSNISTATIDGADTAWMMIASAFVLLMTPGLAFFYGGMIDKKNIISTMLQSFVALGIVSVIWVIVGFSLAFGESVQGIIGNPMTYFNFRNVGLAPNPDFSSTIPFLLFALFQLKFAIITPALITGSFAGRIRFSGYIVFMILFSLLVYTPIAHMTWHPDGLFRSWGVLDFAGGAVVHMSSGFAALAGAFFLGKRIKEIDEPSNIAFVILGTSLLWFGWFGFNAGSALAANGSAVQAFANTNFASATSMITWILFERAQNRKISALGACMGAIIGLIAITPSAGYVTIGQSIFIGFIASLISNFAVRIASKTNVDDTLDVFPSHGIAGVVGMILTGVFAHEVGLIYGSSTTFLYNMLALVIVIVYTFSSSWLLYFIVNFIIPIRVSDEQESRGLDITQHGETLMSK